MLLITFGREKRPAMPAIVSSLKEGKEKKVYPTWQREAFYNDVSLFGTVI